MSPKVPSTGFSLTNISLRWVLSIPFVLLTMGTVGMVGYLSYQSGQQATENLANQLLRQTSERISDRLTNYLETPQRIVSANHLSLQQGTLNLDDPKGLRQQLWKQVSLYPLLPGTAFWSDQGTAIGYGRIASTMEQKLVEKAIGKTIPFGTVYFFEITINRRRYYLTDAQGNPRQLVLQFKDDFRSVTWYRQAKMIGKKAWTPVSFARVLPILQTIAFEPVYDVRGKFQGFFTAHYFLAEISQFLNELKFSPTGKVFIIERTGDLVGTSFLSEALGTHKIQGKLTRLSALQSQDLITREVTKQLIQQFGNFENLKEYRQLNLTVSEQRQFVQITPYQDKFGLDWHIVTIIPESDFMLEIWANVHRTLILCGLALFASVVVGLWIAQRIIKSLTQLKMATQAIGSGNLDQMLPITRINEIKVLSASFQQMKTNLQEADQLRSNYQQDLEREVTEKTKALTEAQSIARLGSWEFEIQTQKITWSKELFVMFGLDPNQPEPNYADYLEMIYPDDRALLQQSIELALSKKISYKIDFRVILADGSIRYHEGQGQIAEDAQGQVIRLLGTALDTPFPA